MGLAGEAKGVAGSRFHVAGFTSDFRLQSSASCLLPSDFRHPTSDIWPLTSAFLLLFFRLLLGNCIVKLHQKTHTGQGLKLQRRRLAFLTEQSHIVIVNQVHIPRQ